jgi:hypothetical protein
MADTFADQPPEQEEEDTTPQLSPHPPVALSPWNWYTVILLLIIVGAGFLWTGWEINQSIALLGQEQRATQLSMSLDQQRETILQNYISQLANLLAHDNLLNARPDDPVRIAANAYTHETLPRLDPARKAEAMRFIYQTRLVNNDSIVLNLSSVDISQAQMANIDLRDTYLVGANLSRADLQHAILSDAILMFTNLSNANLANINLQGADMHNSNLTGANLAGANLRDVTGLTSGQLSQARSLAGATMPDGSVHR